MENMTYTVQSKLQRDVTWLKLTELPFTGTISRVDMVKGKYKDEPRIEITRGHETRALDVWGSNKNLLIDLLSDDIKAWLGATIFVDEHEGKRVVRGATHELVS